MVQQPGEIMIMMVIWIFLLTGTDDIKNPVSKIYHNNGNNTFTEQTSISLTGVDDGSAAWGDYNNDGYLGYFINRTSTIWNAVSKIIIITEIIHLQNKLQFSLTGVGFSSVAWGDYDNDGDLDILLTGYNSGQCYLFQKFIVIMEIIHLQNKHQYL